MYHYSLVFPKQVEEKCRYYQAADWAKREGAETWARTVFGELNRPFHPHNVFAYPSWLEHYSGDHVEAIMAMRQDLLNGTIEIDVRNNDDVHAMIRTMRYRVGRALLKLVMPLYWLWFRMGRTAWRMLLHPRWAAMEIARRIRERKVPVGKRHQVHE